ncbi:hypothetical protein HDV05_004289 [Chytridiales sp. JEL 0842]|nr:hypothetical protein HDV05_004289 [Chytridiales sp. JEL 0842]
MFPMTEDANTPKALLPVANKPMIYYQLQWLEDAHITDIMVICYETAHRPISNYVHKLYEKLADTKIEVLKVKDNLGSADALRHAANRIKTDFLVLGCDLITNYPPHKLLDVHRIQGPAVTALFYEAIKPEDGVNTKKDEEMTEYIGIDHSTCRLLMTEPLEDLDDELPVRMAMFEKFPTLNIHSKLREAHLYVFKRWVIDLVVKSKVNSIKSELIPLLIQSQFSDRVLKREGIDKLLASPANGDTFQTARKISSTGGGLVGSATTPSVVCTAVVAKEGYCFRANTQWTYLEGNRQMTKHMTEGLIAENAGFSQRTQVGPDSMVGEGTRLGERTGVKKSVIGKHCIIGRNVKIVGSVIMDHVIIDDNVKLEGSIVCNDAKIGESSHVKDCQIGAGYKMDKDTQAKNESFID